MKSLRQLPAAFLLGVLALARPASADDKDTAKTLFEQGVEQLEKKDYERACPALSQSQKLDPRPGTLFTLAECEAQQGHGAVAYARYGEYLEVYASLSHDKQVKQGTRERDARAKRAALERNLAQVTLKLASNAPDGTVVARDGIALGAREIGAPLMLDPGAHVLTTQAPGGPLTEQRITIEKGEKRSIALEVRVSGTAGPALTGTTATTTAPPPSSAATAAAPINGRRIATFVSGGVGIAGLIAGGITGGLMLAKVDTIKANCTEGSPGVQLCNTEGANAGNSAKLLGTIATAGFAVGAAGIGVAVILFATSPRDAGTRPARGSVGVRVTSMGSAGTMVGVEGSF